MQACSIVLFRSDLRLDDNPALYHAILMKERIIPVYIYEEHYDSGNEETFEKLGAATKLWLHYSLKALSKSLADLGSRLLILKGKQKELVELLLKQLMKQDLKVSVYWNRRYEPHHIALDSDLKSYLKENKIEHKSFSASLLIEPWSLLNKQGKVYQVYTPFSKRCFEILENDSELARVLNYKLKQEHCVSEEEQFALGLLALEESVNDLGELALQAKHSWTEKLLPHVFAGENNAKQILNKFLAAHDDAEARIRKYATLRDIPSLQGTSRLSTHLHFGEISPKQIWAKASLQVHSLPYLKQILWREFAHYLLYHFPHTVNQPLRQEFKNFNWRELSGEEKIEALAVPALLRTWQRGETGYPIVDAGMKELWETAWMHNRARMIVASFLVKDLRIHWVEGARWFWDTLFDANLANNTMGWQWVSGSGADAAPYFRIFNPVTQSERFDPEGRYISQYLKALRNLNAKSIHAPWKLNSETLRLANIDLGSDYPRPLVDHDIERKNSLHEFKRLREVKF